MKPVAYSPHDLSTHTYGIDVLWDYGAAVRMTTGDTPYQAIKTARDACRPGSHLQVIGIFSEQMPELGWMTPEQLTERLIDPAHPKHACWLFGDHVYAPGDMECMCGEQRDRAEAESDR